MPARTRDQQVRDVVHTHVCRERDRLEGNASVSIVVRRLCSAHSATADSTDRDTALCARVCMSGETREVWLREKHTDDKTHHMHESPCVRECVLLKIVNVKKK